MRIGIDVRVLGPTEQAGLGVRRYVRRVLEDPAGPPSGATVTLYGDFGGDHLVDLLDARRFGFRRMATPLGRSSLWEQGRVPLAALRDRLDVFWATSYTAPLWTTCGRMVSIYDISYDLDPNPALAAIRTLSRRAAHRADLVMTCSEYSRRQMIERWGLPPDRVRVVLLAADPPDTTWPARAEATLARLGVDGPYLLHVGTFYSRRCVPTVVRAFAAARRARPDARLVLVGRNRTDPHEPIEALVDDVNAAARARAVLHLPTVSEADLAVLYGRASGFVYLSTLEGFGLPPLEAMAYGVPVVTTSAGSLAEVVGDAACLVDPLSEADVARAFASVLTDETVRADLVRRGLANVARFSWTRAARETWDLLAETAGARRG